jgi:putative ABC transport system permease protein
MIILAWANLTHRKVRSALSVLAVAIAIALLLVLWGLSRGTLNEVSRRMESVQAEIVVRDHHFDLGSLSGGKLWEKEIAAIQAVQLPAAVKAPEFMSGVSPTPAIPAVEHVMPVYLGRMKLGGMSQNVFGVYPADFKYFAGARRLLQGRIFEDVPDPQQALDAVEHASSTPDNSKAPGLMPGVSSPAADTPTFVLELVIDHRLAQAAALNVGDECRYGDCPARVVGIVETGVAGRVFAPINLLRAANGVGGKTAHMFFVKAANNLTTTQLQHLCELIENQCHRSATLVADYSQVLADSFKSLTVFVNLISIIALIICFLFILVTMYTIVLERGREIAILQSLGAGRAAILRQTIQESLLICTLGTLAGMLLAWGTRSLVETFQPLIVIEMRPAWFALAALVGVLGGVVTAMYPSWLALRHDPIEALNFE